MRSLFFTPKPEDVPEEPVSDRQPEEIYLVYGNYRC